MRKAILSALLSLAVLAGITVTSQVPATSQSLVPGIADATVSIDGVPEVVPPGGGVVFKVVVGSDGVLPVTPELTVELASGFVYDGSLAPGSCSADGTTVTCQLGTLAPSGSETVLIDAAASSVEGLHTTTATVRDTGPFAFLEYEENNEDTTTTEVDGDATSGLLKTGEKMEMDAGDGRQYTVHGPAEGDDAKCYIVDTLEPASGEGRDCDGSACGEGFLLKFNESVDECTTNDPTQTVKTDQTYGPWGPCRGVGNDCTQIFWAADGDATELTKMERCPGSEGSTAGTGELNEDDESPCINRIYKLKGEIWFETRKLTKDPIELPIGGLL